MASHTGCQLQVLGLLAGDGLDCIGCTACWASCTWTRTDRTKRYHVGDRLHRSFQLCLPLGPSLEAGSEDRAEDEDRPLFSIQLGVRDPQTVDCGDSRLKLKAGRAHYRDRSTGSGHPKVRRAH